jgi:hypothetical protein
MEAISLPIITSQCHAGSIGGEGKIFKLDDYILTCKVFAGQDTFRI